MMIKPRDEFKPVLPEGFGFGEEVMKQTKVCVRCGAAQHRSRYVCIQCGAKLPQRTLFHLYQQSHRLCPVCDTVLTGWMKFCPHCGTEQGQAEEIKEKISG